MRDGESKSLKFMFSIFSIKYVSNSNFNTPKFVNWILFIFTSALIFRVIHFTLRYSVNILFYDQWAFYTPLFSEQNIWHLFTWQHGPHRQGIGLLVSRLITSVTQWNTVADSIAISVLLILSTILAFQLKYKLFRSLNLWDLIIPFLFLTLFQYEGIIVVANLSYGAFPILLIMLYCLVFFIKNKYIKFSSLLTLNFLLIYTGWGLFMGGITIFIFSAKLIIAIQKRKHVLLTSVAWLISIILQLLFFINYHYMPAISCSVFSTSYFLQYPIFIGLMNAAFFGFHMRIIGNFAILVGLIIFVCLLLVLYHRFQLIIKNGFEANPMNLIITVLISYSLIFCFFTSVGRICTGLHLAQVSRYITLLIPGFLGFYFHLLTLKKNNFVTLILTIYFIATSIGSLPLGIIEKVAASTYIAKTNWKSCYLQTYDIEICNEQTNFIIYPENDVINKKMDYLKENRLNLFKN